MPLRVYDNDGGLNAAAVGLLVPTMFVVYDTLQAGGLWAGFVFDFILLEASI